MACFVWGFAFGAREDVVGAYVDEYDAAPGGCVGERGRGVDIEGPCGCWIGFDEVGETLRGAWKVC